MYEEYIEKCKKEMFKHFDTDIYYTVKILIWNDGDFKVVITHGDKNADSHIFSIHKSVSEDVSYVTTPFLSNAVKEDKYGNLYYVPNELIRYLNNETPVIINKHQMKKKTKKRLTSGLKVQDPVTYAKHWARKNKYFSRLTK